MINPDSPSRTAVIAMLFIAGCFLSFASAFADDWPQWRGPERNGVSAETGLIQSWPEGGPKLAWQKSGFGIGYSSIVVGRGRLFTMGRHGEEVIVTALDINTQQPIWKQKIGETTRNPSSTPTLDGEFLYVLDPDGDLACLRVETGEFVWQKSFEKEFVGRMMSARGNGESPLIDRDRLVCTPGGNDAAMVALDKRTGQVLWKAKLPELGPNGKDGASFSSAVVTEAAGIRQYVQLMGRGLMGFEASSGRFLWNYNAIANAEANIPTPIVHDDFVFAANGYTAGSVLLKLMPTQDQSTRESGVSAEVVYALTGSQFQNHHGGVIRIGDYLYSGHGNNNGLPTCVEFQTGRIVWKRRGPGVGSAAIVAADGNLIFRYQDGVVALIEATPRGYKLKGTFEIPGNAGDSWSHPVVANGMLYLREQDILYVHDLRLESTQNTNNSPANAMKEGNHAFVVLGKLGVTIQPLREFATAMTAPADARKRSLIYTYSLEAESQPCKDSAQIVTLSDIHLSPRSTLVDEVFEALKNLPGPIIVNLSGTRVSDAGLKQLQQLDIVALDLELCGQITNAGLKHLQQVKPLRALILAATGVTQVGIDYLTSNSNLIALDLELCDGIKDDACKTIGAMTQLRMLVLKKSGFERPGITDVGLQRLQGLSNLEVLNLYANSLTDDGLKHLQPFKKLRDLNLSLLDLTDAGFVHIKPLNTLEHLELLFTQGFAGPELTDQVVECLEPLVNLKSLNLTGSQLTDGGLKRLQVLKNLKLLQLARTKVTDEGLQSFRAKLPDCEILR